MHFFKKRKYKNYYVKSPELIVVATAPDKTQNTSTLCFASENETFSTEVQIKLKRSGSCDMSDHVKNQVFISDLNSHAWRRSEKLFVIDGGEKCFFFWQSLLEDPQLCTRKVQQIKREVQTLLLFSHPYSRPITLWSGCELTRHVRGLVTQNHLEMVWKSAGSFLLGINTWWLGEPFVFTQSDQQTTVESQTEKSQNIFLASTPTSLEATIAHRTVPHKTLIGSHTSN